MVATNMPKADKSVNEAKNADDNRELSWPIPSERRGERRRMAADATHLSVGQRLEYALSLLPSKDWVEQAGRSTRQLQRYIGGADVPLSVLTMLSAGSGLPIEWLVSGKPAAPATIGDEPPMAPPGFIPVDQKFSFIPRLEVRASAGGGAVTVHEQAIDLVAFRSDWLRRLGINPRHARTLFASGDSMEPTIGDGDLLLVDESIDRVVDHGIYVVVYQEMVLVKRVQLRLDGTLVMMSDNRQYKEELVPPGDMLDVRIAGRVRWYGRTI
jgi:phage repressor protein C with HTH and peptisase S24 domain